MKTWTKETIQIIRLNLKNIVLFELGCRLFTVPVYLQLLRMLLRFSLKQAGYSYLTAENFSMFILKPWTFLCLLAAAVCGMFFLIVEVAGLITAYQGSAYTRRLTPFNILTGGIGKLAGQPFGRNLRLAFVVVVHYIIINLAYLFRMLTHIKPINFIIQEVGTKPLFLIAAGLLLALTALAAAGTMFTLYGCMIEQKNFRDSCNRSRNLLKGNIIRTLIHLFACQACLLLVIALFYFLGVVLSAVFVVLFTRQNLAMAVLTGACNGIEMILLFLGGAASVVTHFGALTVFYYQYGHRDVSKVRWDFSFPGNGEKTSRLALGLTAAAGILSAFFIFDLVRNGSALANNILIETSITAHRGSSRQAPENTMAAIQAAVEDMADYVEIDVQMTADGVVVLGHDASLKRVAGVDRAIGSMTWSELRQLDAGSWFSDRFAGEKIPQLQEVLEYCKGKIKLNIELKYNGKDSLLPETVAGQIAANEMEEQCVITSTSLEYLRKVKTVMPELHTGYIISAAYGNFYSEEAVDFISIRSNFVDGALVKNAHAQGRAIHAWTVNQRTELERLRMLGVDNIITDYPVMAREIIYQEESKESLLAYLRMVFGGV